MKTLFSILFGILNVFLGALVSHKVYEYFSPHTGLEMPEITYMNMLALTFIISILFAPMDRTLKIEAIYKHSVPKEDRSIPSVYSKTVMLLLAWFFCYIWYSILF